MGKRSESLSKSGPWIGKIILSLRKKRDMDRKSLAAAVGVDQTHLKRLEDGEVGSPSIDFVVAVARALSVPVTTFIKDSR